MTALTATANLVEHSTIDEPTRITATFGRSELDALLSVDSPPMLWFDLGIEGEAEPQRLTLELTGAEVEALLDASTDDGVLLAIDGEGLVGLLGEPEVEAHGIRGALAVAIATAAVAAPSGLAATPQSVSAAVTQQSVSAAVTQQGVGAAVTSQQIGAAVTTQVSTQVVAQRAKSAAKVQRAAPAKLASLTILRAGVVR